MLICHRARGAGPRRAGAGRQKVVAFVAKGFSTVGLGLCGVVFADRPGTPGFDFLVAARRPGPVRSDLGLVQRIDHGLDRVREADLVILVPAGGGSPGPAVVEAVRTAHRRGATVASFCSGTFLLAETGLLDGRRATTHWRMADELAVRYPRVQVEPDALYIDEGRLVTGAGGAEGLDMLLHLVGREHGASVATAIAREIVGAPHRPGGRRTRYVSLPAPARSEDERITTVLEWVGDHLHQPHSVDDLAARTLMSPRTFNRRFKAATGVTPHSWLRAQRLRKAEELLETTDLGIEEIARLVGYRTGSVLRKNFTRARGIPPRTYRRAVAHRLTVSPRSAGG
jgi:transcriptional regulator GlxA family with amidase domain